MSKKTIVRLLGWSTLSGVCGTIMALTGTYLYLNPALPDVETLKQIELQVPLRIFSADKQLLGEFGEKRRDPITFEEIPQGLADAILSAEDDGFYAHQGVDIKGLLRAVSQLLLSGSIQSGGSTITMQVARNFFLSRNQTFSRKFNEILLAIKIEQELTKEEILTLYLNKIYLGNRAYGVKAAAQVYYGKPVGELSLAQMAMISGLPKAPSTFNPIVNPDRALIRRDWILGRMLSLGKIDQATHDQAVAEPITATYHGQKLDIYAPYVAEMAREKALELFGDKAYTGGYNIITTVDSRLQLAGQQAIIDGLLAYTERHGYRGPEKKLDTTLLTTSEVSDYSQWLSELDSIPSYGNLQPAAVINIKKKSFTALLKTGETVVINWEDGLSNKGAYVNENFFSPPPKTADKIVSIGDVVRIHPKNKTIKNDDGSASTQQHWYFSQVPSAQAALIALNPTNGGIKTIVGGFDFNQSSFNRVHQAKRLPGSNFKPFVYSIGLENGLNAASIFNDAPIVIEDTALENTWRPENSSGKFYGPTPLRKALYLSRNLVSIRLLRTLGIDTVRDNLGKFGLKKDDIPRDLSIALGTYAMTPLEVATGYTVFANNGYKIEPFLIDSITDSQGNTVYKTTPYTVITEKSTTEPQLASIDNNNPHSTLFPSLPSLPEVKKDIKAAPKVMDERVTYIMNSILRDVVTKGTAKKAQSLNRSDIGGKTGTTNGPTDAWFSGFNQHIVATTWLGFDNNKNIGKREYGGTAALPIWIDFMRAALDGVPESLPPQPDGMITVRINPETGKATSPSSPIGVDEIFLEENAPEEVLENNDGSNESSVIPEDIF